MGVIEAVREAITGKHETGHVHEWSKDYDYEERFKTQWTVTSTCKGCGDRHWHKEVTPLTRVSMAALGMIAHTTWIDLRNPHLAEMIDLAKKVNANDDIGLWWAS